MSQSSRKKAEAFLAHLEPLQPALEAFCRRSLRDPEDVADALQSAVTAAFRDFDRYAEGTNPNGSINDIAGIVNEGGNVLGLMPHPENLIEAAHGGIDGRGLFESALGLPAQQAA